MNVPEQPQIYLEADQRHKAAGLFAGWEETLIWSCLQGYMGTMWVDDENAPTSAVIDVGDFCCFAGVPNAALLPHIRGFKLLIPRDDAWAALLERAFGNRLTKMLRYAIKKEPDVFDTKKLASFVDSLSEGYDLRLIDEEIYHLSQKEAWSADLCGNFATYAEFERLALGAAVLQNGQLVAGASSYGVYRGGIEIEIDTKPEFRRQGLATVCGAKLILECLARGLYPSWDAHDLRSVALAEKLGYHLSHPYVAYELQ